MWEFFLSVLTTMPCGPLSRRRAESPLAGRMSRETVNCTDPRARFPPAPRPKRAGRTIAPASRRPAIHDATYG